MNKNNSNKNQFNEDLKLLNDYPFQRLNNLLKNISIDYKKRGPIAEACAQIGIIY